MITPGLLAPSHPADTVAARRYCAFAGLAAALLVGLAAGANYFVDPFDYFGRNTLGVYISAEREAKITGLRAHPHDAVLLGNSKAAMLDASALRGPAPFYDAALGGALPEEMTALAQRISPDAPLVVVALDFFQFGDSAPLRVNPFPPDNWHSTFNYLFNLEGVGYAFTTLKDAWRGDPPELRADGSFESAGWRRNYDRADADALAKVFAQREATYRQFHFSSARVAQLVLLRNALQARGTPFVVAINPLQAEDLRQLRAAGLGPAVESWRAQVRAVFPGVVDLMESKYDDPKNFFRLDPVHLYPETAAAIFNAEVLPHAIPASADTPPRP